MSSSHSSIDYIDLNPTLIGDESSFFDVDLINNPEHDKRFVNLKLTNFDATLVAGNDKRHFQTSKEIIFFSLALILSLGINAYLLNWKVPYPPLKLSDAFSLELKIEQPPLVESIRKTIPLEKMGEQTRFQETDLVELDLSRIDSADETEPPGTSTADKNYQFRDQIESAVTNYLLKPDNKVIAPDGDSLAAPGVVFNRKLVEILNSPEIERLNRWRAPLDDQLNTQLPAVSSAAGVDVGMSGSNLYKIGDSCYSMSFNDIANNTPSVPMMGNGWNLRAYRKIDCSLLYLDEQLKRSDINRAPVR